MRYKLFANLDPTSQIVLKKMLTKLNRDRGCAMVISSHNLNHIVEVSTRIVLLENGKIIKDVRNMQASHEVAQQLESYFAVVE